MPLPAIPIAYELISLLVLAVGAAIATKPRNNNSSGSSSANDVFGGLSDIFSSEPPSGVLCCGKKSGKLETPIHSPDTRPYVNPPYYDDELNAYIHPMRPDEDLDNYTYIRPGVYYDPETGRYVTPIHQKDAADLVYNSDNVIDPKKLQSRQGRREMTPRKVKKFTKEMQKNGYGDYPAIDVYDVDGDLIIKDGHHRARAAVNAGLDEVPINRIEVTDEAMKKRLRDQVFDAKINN